MRQYGLLLIMSLLLIACGSGAQELADGRAAGDVSSDRGGSLARDLRDAPFHFPCQSETEGEKVAGSPATCVTGPTLLIGCITDEAGNGIGDASTEIDPSRSEATVTAMVFLTREDGRYVAPNIVETGWYSVTAGASGYGPETKRVLIREGGTAVLDFRLKRASNGAAGSKGQRHSGGRTWRPSRGQPGMAVREGLSGVSPEQGGTVCATPDIRVSLDPLPREMITRGGTISLDGSSLVLDGADVTAALHAISADYTGEVWYPVRSPLAAGRHIASFSFPNDAGGRSGYTWSFTVTDKPCPAAGPEPTPDRSFPPPPTANPGNAR